jgi:hypothetical protein
MAVDKFPVESGHVMMFARSIGDANEIYYDEDYAKSTDQGAIIAPPTFVQSSAQFDPDYFLRPKVGEEWFGSAKGPTGITKKKESGGGGGGLHAEQHYVYHRQFKVGDVLTEYRDQNGELLITATGVGVRTERPATSGKK